MKILIFAVVGLLVGTLGGTAYSGFKERDVLVAEMEAEKAAAKAAERAAEEAAAGHEQPSDDALSAEEDGHGPEGAGSSGEASDPPDQGHAEEPASAEPDPEDPGTAEIQEGIARETPGAESAQSQPVPEALDATAASGSQRDPNLPPLGGSEGAVRLAKIFGAMKGPEAAEVLEKLDDDEIESILVHMSNRKAAEIIQNLEAGRAARLSRRVLDSGGGNGS